MVSDINNSKGVLMAGYGFMPNYYYDPDRTSV